MTRDSETAGTKIIPLWPASLGILVGTSLFCYGYLYYKGATIWMFFLQGFTSDGFKALGVAAVPILLLIGLLLATRHARRWQPGLLRMLERHTSAIDGIPVSRLAWWIMLAAGAGLFLELALIRVHASYFQLFAYFKNVSLLSCFLGLGIGYAIGRARWLATPLALPLFAIQVSLMYVLRFQNVAQYLQNPITEVLTFGMNQLTQVSLVVTVYGFLILFFCLNTLCFIPLGQVASRLMSRSPPLRAYSWNLIGSLGGIVLFALLSMAWTPPAVWLAVGMTAVLFLVRGGARVYAPSAVSAVALLGVLGIAFAPTQVDIYSPYQILSMTPRAGEPPSISVNNVYYQRILDLGGEGSADFEDYETWARHYALPYQFKPSPPSVLVVGAGSGNDVAAALRAGAGRVDAVEIDPAIQRIGKLLHPEQPYQSERVRAIINDARAHIRHADDTYDLIVYGLLDSHTLLSGKGSVRLDSYVYTVEAFREARARLNDDGVLCLTFAMLSPAVGRKLYLMLTEAFDGRAPLVFRTRYDGGHAFVTGPGVNAGGLPAGLTLEDVSADFAASSVAVDMATDDWPFFYMKVRAYPGSYVTMLLLLLLASTGLVRSFVRPRAGTTVSLPCFFLGVGFMLVETKGITELALAFGSTWVVISVVIAAILVMALLANGLVMRFGRPRLPLVYGLVIVSLLVGLAVTPQSLADLAPWVERLVLLVLLTLPLFFSGLAFSTELDRSASVPVALSSNLLGAMLGGVLEYNSMFLGFESLYWLAVIMYAGAWATSQLRVPRFASQTGSRARLSRIRSIVS